ncbi:MAG: DUF2206 domain-containing protein [Methanospirillum sp.]|nr:DUF2206 domain-containing protein [Methanospirillum sp.]
MRVRNPLQLNDWGIVSFIGVVLGIQLLLWLTLVLEENGAGIPLLRQIVGFVYLTWIPGVILLRILRVHRLGVIETLLISIGLSLVIVMFIGFGMNTIYPMLELLRPISEGPLLITLTVYVFAGSVIAFIVDRDFNQPEYIDVGETFGWQVIAFALLPFLAIFGTWLVNNYRINSLLLILLAIIAIVPALVAFRRIVPERHYPFVIWTVALALLFHTSLISNHIWGWDINQEFYIANLVIQNGAWDFSIYSNINAMLSIVMLAPVYSLLCSIDLVWVFKIVYPLIFSLAAPGVYMIARRQSYDRIAFFSSFLFITFFVFYQEMLQVARQEIAEFFLIMIALLIINKDLDKIKKYIILIMFSFSLAVSHYGLSYVFMVSLVLAWMILIVSEVGTLNRLRSRLSPLFEWAKRGYGSSFTPRHAGERAITLDFVLLFFIFALSWYMFISSASTLNSITGLALQFSDSLVDGFLNPETSQGLAIIVTRAVTPLHQIGKYIQLVVQFFIFFGILSLLFKPQKMDLGGEYFAIDREYFALSLVNFAIAAAGVILPFFASALNTTRLYQITLIFLAPFFVIGVMEAFGFLSRALRQTSLDFSRETASRTIAAFLCIFVLFNTGFIYSALGDEATSIALDDRIDYPRFNTREIAGAEWLHAVGNRTINSDSPRAVVLEGFVGRMARKIPTDPALIRKNSYVFLGTYNVLTEKLSLMQVNEANRVNVYADIGAFTVRRGVIYDNGGARVFE